MSREVTGKATTRRRNDELMRAIREAVLAELADHDYAGVTFEGVARRARTSKPVLYRRYRSRAHMVVDAFTTMASEELAFADTGTLRSDLLLVLGLAVDRFQRFGINAYRGLISEADDDLRDVIIHFTNDRIVPVFVRILEDAHARGEIGPEPLAERVVLLPIVMLRHELLQGRPFDPASIVGMVDEIYLPLLSRVSHPG